MRYELMCPGKSAADIVGNYFLMSNLFAVLCQRQIDMELYYS